MRKEKEQEKRKEKGVQHL